MAEGLAPSIAGNTAAQSGYSPGERGDPGISALSGWLRSYLLTTLPPLLFVLPPWTGDAVPAAHGACRRGRGVIRGPCPGRPCPGTALLLPGGAWVAVPRSLLGGPGRPKPGWQASLCPAAPAVPRREGWLAWVPVLLLARPPPREAALLPVALCLKCPDGQGPAGRGLSRAWNSPCSGIRVGQGPGS